MIPSSTQSKQDKANQNLNVPTMQDLKVFYNNDKVAPTTGFNTAGANAVKS